ncbi:histidinol-phosphate transaminase [Aquirufa sp. OSTEICH-129A]
MNYQSIILPHIWNLKPYSSARDEFKGKEGIFLDANENPLGSPLPVNWNRYPDPMQWDIKHELADIKHIPVEQIFIGNGSDEAIDLIMRMTCAGQENSIILCPPTYGMYEVSASINHVKIISVPLTKEYQLNVSQILSSVQADTRIIFICSPNNPTGNKINRTDIYKIIDSFQQGFVLIDEAYIDFSDEPSFIHELDKYPNVIVMQTLSKAYGLASLRLGMAFANPQIIQILNKIKPPYNISGATQALVLEALKNREFLFNSIQQINHAKNTLISKLEAMPQVVKVYPSQANFILVKMERAQDLFDYLISQKVITRSRTNVALCEDSIRITVGLPEENQILIQKMQEFYS